jgi:hypothetical protein
MCLLKRAMFKIAKKKKKLLKKILGVWW